MHVTTILGSPKSNGNTSKVLAMFEKDMLSRGDTVDHIHIVDFDIGGCLGCGACQQVSDKPGCVQKDDTPGLFERLMNSDALVYASPLYGWDFTSQMKPFLDRHFSLLSGVGTSGPSSFLEGRGMALLVTCSGPVENNADLIQQMFDRLNHILKGRMIGKYIVPLCVSPETINGEGKAVSQKMVADFSVFSPS